MARLKTPTRTITNAGQKRVIGCLPSVKNQAPAPWESQAERDFFYYLEFRRDVLRYKVQPIQVTLVIDGKAHRYTVDVKVVFVDGTIWYVEVKLDKEADDPEWRRLFDAAERYFRRSKTEHGDFAVVRASALREGFFMDNIRLLYRYAKWPAPDGTVKAVLSQLPETDEPTLLGELIEWAAAQQVDLGVIYHLMFTQRITADLISSRIDDETPLWRAPA